MATSGKCPIWGSPSSILAGTRDTGFRVQSLRAGGEYRISAEAMDDYSLSPSQQAVVTNWLVDQRRFGQRSPLINTDVLDGILAQRPLRFSEQRDRFFLALSTADFKPGALIVPEDDFEVEDQAPVQMQTLLAWLGVETFDEGEAIIHMLRDEGHLRANGAGLTLTSRGFETMEAFRGGANSLQAFVAMWFDEEMKEAWRTGFAPGIRDAGYEAFRIDGLHHNGKIDDEIVAQIKRSRFLIADFTCGGSMVDSKFQPNPRGGVYYEAGLAHGLGMEVIFTCRKNRMDYLHFDTRQFAHIVWETPADLRAQLYNRIAATLKEGPSAPGPGRGAVDPEPNS